MIEQDILLISVFVLDASLYKLVYAFEKIFVLIKCYLIL